MNSHIAVSVLALACALASTTAAAVAAPAAEPLTFISGGATLAATLYRAAAPGARPAVVLLGGTGPVKKDAPAFVALIAPFTTAGFDVLTFDKRGVGASPGRFDPYQSLESLAEDGVAAVHALQRVAGVDARRIGVWGVSQGGWVAPLMATKSPDVAFVISVSASGATPAEVEIFQRGQQMLGEGFGADDVHEVTAFRRVVWAYLGTGYGRDAGEAAYAKARTRPWFAALKFAPALGTPDTIDPGLREFYRQMLYDPARTAERVSVPVLVIFGAKDGLAPVDVGVSQLMLAYARGGNKQVAFAVFADGGHGLQLVTTEREDHAASEHAATSGGYVPVPGYIDRMVDFLLALPR
jgi:pimeloyl-ACP methyl ester carboxylesterase